MSHVYRCCRCKEIKPAEEYKYYSNGQRSAYCKACEADYKSDKSKLAQVKTNKRQYIIRSFKSLCALMKPVELDNLLFDLKKIREEYGDNDS